MAARRGERHGGGSDTVHAAAAVPLLEWASLLSLLLWFACVALALLRRPSE
jgi:hypothetical protein